MPTYTVTTAINRLTPRQKTRIAQEITRIHQAVTGAQPFFAQVIFTAVDPADHFIGGKPLQHDLIYLHGHIRAGRTPEQKQNLLTQLIQSLAEAASAPPSAIWDYLTELPPAQMAEFGHTLPTPGTETTWLQSLPSEDRALLERITR
jgi:phenylpyruvate tautomerase PptA (4-oxalocrotonate tautomerase family)